jgi:hypothetical protein
MKRLIIKTALVATLFVAAPQAKAIPVIDGAHIAAAAANAGLQVLEWVNYIKNFKEYYSTINAVYNGVRDWKNMGWVDTLQLVELPWFDGMEGIEDIRNIAAGTSMSLSDLQTVFSDLKWFDKMLNDPRYAEQEAFRKKTQILQKANQRGMRRKMTITRAMHKMNEENQKLLKQSKDIQAEIETLSKKEPAPLASIAALQGRLAGIQAKMQSNKDGLYAQITAMEQQEQAEYAQTQDKIQTELYDMRRNSTYVRDVWKGFLK